MHDRRRVRALAVLAALALCAAAALGAGRIYEKVLDLRYGARVPVPAMPAPRDAAEARRQDLDVLAGLTSVDRSFTPGARAAFAQVVAQLRARAGALDDGQFFLGVAAAVALSGNAHSSVDAESWRASLPSAPVRLAWFPEGLHVVRAMTGHEDLLGVRVAAIDGIDPAKLREEATRYFPGTAQRVQAMSPLLLESPAVLHALHPDAPADALVVDVDDPVHGARRVSLPAVPAREAAQAGKPGWTLSPEPLPGETPGSWHPLLDARTAPPSLRGPDHRAYFTTLDAGRALYLHLWQVRGDPGAPLGDQIRRALGDEGAPAWGHIVLDLRFNDGGDYQSVYHAMRALPKRLAPDGRLDILTDETTFSAAIITAVLAKHDAAGRARIVGSAAGDGLAFWAEGTPLTLPHSRIRIGVATGYHDWAHGCREWRCWWPNFYYDVAGGDIEPQLAVRWQFADYARGVDTVLERALPMKGTP
jgi:hypothetical protein